MKNKITRLIIFVCLLACFSVFLPHNSVKEVSALETDTYEGLDFSDGKNCYKTGEIWKEAPATFEAMVKINESKGSKDRYGVILGNYTDTNNANSFNVEITADGKPRFYYNKGAISYIPNVKINTGKWTHLAFVRDYENSGYVYCYINGELVATYTSKVSEAKVQAVPKSAMSVGMDGRGNSKYPLQGSVAWISVSSSIKSSQEIAVAYEAGLNGVSKAGTNGVLYSASFAEKYDASKTKAYYRAEEAFTTTPNTFTATFKVAAGTQGRIGNILGNYAGSYSENANYPSHAINLELNASGQVRLFWDKGAPDVTFTSKDFRTGFWEHITVVRDKENGCFKLYSDGVLIETKTPASGVGEDVVSEYSHAIGNDVRQTTATKIAFMGQIKDVAVYSTALSDEEIALENSTLDKKTITNENWSVMANWVLDDTQQRLVYDKDMTPNVVDNSGSGNNAYLCTINHYYEPIDEDWFKAGEDEYTIVFYPDIQTTVSEQPNLIFKQNEWVINHADDMNLQMVLTLGDIINGHESHWNVTRSAFAMFDEADVAYSLVLGNHDYDENALTAANGRNASNFNAYFKYDTFVNEEHFVEAKIPGKMENACYTFGEAGVNYLVFGLEFGPSDSTMEWVVEVCDRPEYADYRVILTTHSLVHSDGTFNDLATLHNPANYNFSTSDQVDVNTGQEMWDEYLSKIDNLFINACGHIINDTVMRRTDIGVNGNQVLSMLIDGQSVKTVTGMAGATLILVCKINEKTKQMTCRYYNPLENRFYCVENQFTYDFSDVESKAIKASEGVEVKGFAKAGEVVEFTVNGLYGRPVVKDKKGNPIEVINNNENYSFVMPNIGVSIMVDKIEIPQPEHTVHIYFNQVVEEKYLASEATCTEKATYYYSCECGEAGTLTFEVGLPIPHIHDQKVIDDKYLASDATCHEKATYYYSCICGDKGVNSFESTIYKEHEYLTNDSCQSKECIHCHQAVAAVSGHNWDKGLIVKQPTTTAEGELIYTCTICGNTYSATIAKLAKQKQIGLITAIIFATISLSVSSYLVLKKKKNH